jgi:hypothetical protein
MLALMTGNIVLCSRKYVAFKYGLHVYDFVSSVRVSPRRY